MIQSSRGVVRPVQGTRRTTGRGPPPSTPYERRKRRVLAATAGQAWVFFAAWESLPFFALICLGMLLARLLGALS